ncbi:flagellar biosynthesis protein FliT [Mangrovibacter sp. MFB070]|uniref:flagella biosynthesis regulatory protein FliT n=1 Tax=Mangrovibacter sp. MFB070 TaxID=1224318 RepID=UPI0004D5F41C|nr:flagella biosynthesis regulatory protein FliT [Mangrovibacter sp. MFB070]KEA51553.1 flagellar biosynthesis protein FliT [Mangrovibacter sp. MFB070]
MNTVNSSLTLWHALHALSKTMLNLAHEGKWDELIEHEVKYVQLVESIAKNPVPPEQVRLVEEARDLLREILANEATLKGLLQSRMDDLRKLIGQTGKQKTLATTYGKFSHNILMPLDYNQ